jgi:hypothetical protein
MKEKRKATNTKEYRKKRIDCEKKYMAGQTDIQELAEIYSVKPGTVENWIRKFGWKTKEAKLRDLDGTILRKADEALLVALEAFIENPLNKDLQSLKGILKEYSDRKKPAREYLDYAVKFQEQFKDFCLERGKQELWEEYRKVGIEFSDYLRVRNA